MCTLVRYASATAELAHPIHSLVTEEQVLFYAHGQVTLYLVKALSDQRYAN